MRTVPAWWPEEESLFLWSRLLRLHKNKRDNETRSSVLEPFGLRGAGLPDPRAERVAGALCRLRCSHWAAGSSASPCPDGAASYTQERRLRPGTEDRGGSLSPRHARPAAEGPFLREYTSTDHVRKHAARRNSARLYEGTQARSQLITKTRADVTSTSARGAPPLGDVDGLPRPQGTRAQQARSGPGDQRLGAVSCSCLLLAEAPGSGNAGPEIPPLALGGCSPPPFACLLCTRHSPRLWKFPCPDLAEEEARQPCSSKRTASLVSSAPVSLFLPILMWPASNRQTPLLLLLPVPWAAPVGCIPLSTAWITWSNLRTVLISALS
nr:uncharacterized protein LOC123282405 [Equus asinus]